MPSRQVAAAKIEISGADLVKKLTLDELAATELHNRLAKEIVARIVSEPLAAGGTIVDVVVLCESVLVGVLIECFQRGGDATVLDAIIVRTKERLAKVRLSDLEPKGRG